MEVDDRESPEKGLPWDGPREAVVARMEAADDDVRRVEWSMIAICVSYLVVMVAVRIDVRIRLSVWGKTKGSVVRKVQREHESYISRPNLEV